MALLLVADLADVNRVTQQLVQRSPREPAPAGPDALLRDPDLRHDSFHVQLLAQLPDAAQLKVAFVYAPDGAGFVPIDHQPPLFNVIAQRRRPSHPHALALGGGYLVPNTLARDLALELGKGEQDI